MKYLIVIVTLSIFNLYSQNLVLSNVYKAFYDKDFEKVIQMSDSLINLNNISSAEKYQVINLKSMSLYNVKEYFEAIQTIGLIDSDEQGYDLLSLKGDCKLKLNDSYGAIEDYSNAIKIIQNKNEGFNFLMIDILVSRAECYMKIKKYEFAIRDYSSAIDSPGIVKDDSAKAFFFRGLANIYLGNKELGCKDFSKSLEFGTETAIEALQKYCN